MTAAKDLIGVTNNMISAALSCGRDRNVDVVAIVLCVFAMLKEVVTAGIIIAAVATDASPASAWLPRRSHTEDVY